MGTRSMIGMYYYRPVNDEIHHKQNPNERNGVLPQRLAFELPHNKIAANVRNEFAEFESAHIDICYYESDSVNLLSSSRTFRAVHVSKSGYPTGVGTQLLQTLRRWGEASEGRLIETLLALPTWSDIMHSDLNLPPIWPIWGSRPVEGKSYTVSYIENIMARPAHFRALWHAFQRELQLNETDKIRFKDWVLYKANLKTSTDDQNKDNWGLPWSTWPRMANTAENRDFDWHHYDWDTVSEAIEAECLYLFDLHRNLLDVWSIGWNGGITWRVATWTFEQIHDQKWDIETATNVAEARYYEE